MKTKCRFPYCCWSGEVNQLYNHCSVYHHKNIKFIGNDNVYTFTANDILEQIYLLCTFEGLYWFILDNHKPSFCNSVRRGIVAIGNSSICTYTMLLTIPGTQLAYSKPRSTATHPEQYDLEINFDKLQYIYPYLSAMRMFIKFETNYSRADNECDVLSNILDLEDREEERKRCNASPMENVRQNQRKTKCNLCSKQLWKQPECPLCMDQFSKLSGRHKMVSKSRAIDAIVDYLLN